MPVEAYQFRVRSSKKGMKPKPPQPAVKTPKIDESVQLGSRMEDWGYRALIALGWPEEDITVQRSIYGGRDFPGGQVVDIVLYKPTSCAISFKGEYWHGKSDQETIDDARIAMIYNEYVVIWWREASTYDMMYQVMLEKVGKP